RDPLTPAGRGRRRRRASHWPVLHLEYLEDRTCPSQFVDLGTLRFAADSFLQNGNTYSTTGKIQLGLAPTGHETFTPLVDIVGTVSFTTGVADPTFQVNGVTNAEIDAVVQGTPAIPLWQATGTTTFDVQQLTTTGVDLGGKGQPLQV